MILRYLSTALLSVTAALAAPSTVTVYSQSVPDTKAPAPLLQVSYDASTLTANVTSYKSPSAPYSDTDPVRVGLYNSGEWGSSVFTVTSSFEDKYQKHVELHVDGEGKVWDVGFATSLKAPAAKSAAGAKKKTKEMPQVQDDEVVVRVVKKARGPSPVLNKPVVLSPDGKPEQKEPEKTLFQKYWWVLALFLVLNLAAGGGEK